MNEYQSLLEYCNTDRQKEIISHLSSHNNKKKTQKDLSINKDNLNRMLRQIKNRKSSKEILSPNTVNTVLPLGFSAKGLSNYYNKDGELSGQWIKMDRDADTLLNGIQYAISEMLLDVEGRAKASPVIQSPDKNNLLNLYISNDLHFGMFADSNETLDGDYNLKIAKDTLSSAINYLVDNSPEAKECIVVDLGDLIDIDDHKNMTPNSGNIMDTDRRYGEILRCAEQSMVDMIEKALTKHEKVYFYNISGNHDISSGFAVRGFVEAWYRNEPRVIVCTSPAPQKYHKHGNLLLGFAHGDGLRMHDAGEVMAAHNIHIFSETVHRFFHFGHNHKDKIVEGRLCKAESHRNLPPLNAWASHKGFMRQIGTMKCLTYCSKNGHKATTVFNAEMIE